MNNYKSEIDKSKNETISANSFGQQNDSKPLYIKDNRSKSVIQQKANNTGLPNQLKSGIENLSGQSMDDVKVHYNSDKPAQLNAHAYAQGTEIHLASGQEKHLPHEAWHVVQQKQGRVKPTMQLKGKVNVNVNDYKGLEKEADVMGMKALQLFSKNDLDNVTTFKNSFTNYGTLQRVLIVKKSDPIKLNDKNYENPIKTSHGDKGVELLNGMINSEKAYDFIDFKELNQAIGAQLLLNTKSELSDLLGNSKNFEKVEEMKPDEKKANSMATSFLLAKKHGVKFFGRKDDVIAWSKNAIIQTIQQRGDKSHVLAAMHVDETLQLILCFEGNFNLATEGDGILESYAAVNDRVCVYYGSSNYFNGNDKIKRLTHSTATLNKHAISNPLKTREKVKLAMTGNMDKVTMELYEVWSKKLGFIRGHKNKYVIVSHRDSGHKVPPGRIPSHPELDTGEGGFMQMITCVEKSGFIPVPMGEPSYGTNMKPNMVKWWLNTPDALKKMGKTKGQIEYGMIRYLAEQYGVRLLAMRSGNTDAMAFAGMETIFLDMASEGLGEKELDEAQLSGSEHAAHNRSWRRATMLETILPGVFHQVFIQHPRPDIAHPKQDVIWDGKFKGDDIAHLEKALKSYFGDTTIQIYNKIERDTSSPLHNEKTKGFNDTVEKRVRSEDKKVGYESIEDFVKEVNANREEQSDSSYYQLNKIALLLENIKTKLNILSHDIKKLQEQLESLRKDSQELKKL